MAIREVLKFPDPRLREVSQPVESVTNDHRKLVEDMLETMYAEAGIGLAAPQIGELIRLLVIDIRPRENGRYKLEDLTDLEKQVKFPIAIFNPEIKKEQGATTYDEGCLSVPTFFETVERAEYVEVTGLDKDGKPLVIKTDGLLAICLQHEMDHLDGKLFIDHLSLVKSNKIKNQIKKHGYPPKQKGNKEDVEI